MSNPLFDTSPNIPFIEGIMPVTFTVTPSPTLLPPSVSATATPTPTPSSSVPHINSSLPTLIPIKEPSSGKFSNYKKTLLNKSTNKIINSSKNLENFQDSLVYTQVIESSEWKIQHSYGDNEIFVNVFVNDSDGLSKVFPKIIYNYNVVTVSFAGSKFTGIVSIMFFGDHQVDIYNAPPIQLTVTPTPTPTPTITGTISPTPSITPSITPTITVTPTPTPSITPSIGSITYNSLIIGDGAVHYWSLDSGLTDDVGSDNLTLKFDATLTSDAYGNELVLPITSNQNNATLDTTVPLTSNFTLEAWTTLTQLNNYHTIFGTSVYGLQFDNTGVLYMYGNNDSIAAPTFIAQLNTIYHVVATVDANKNIIFYVNNVKYDPAVPITDSYIISYLGTDGSNETLYGKIGNPAIYNSVLTEQQIAAHYNFGTTQYRYAP